MELRFVALKPVFFQALPSLITNGKNTGVRRQVPGGPLEPIPPEATRPAAFGISYPLDGELFSLQ